MKQSKLRPGATTRGARRPGADCEGTSQITDLLVDGNYLVMELRVGGDRRGYTVRASVPLSRILSEMTDAQIEKEGVLERRRGQVT